MANKRYEGRTTGMQVMHYQDYTLRINDGSDRRLTDEGLVADWHSEHPEAKHLDEQNQKGDFAYVKDIRRNYNQGKEGHGARDRSGEVVGPGSANVETLRRERCAIYLQ